MNGVAPVGPTLFERVSGADGIASLMLHFYADVRQHAVLGPIFDARIHDWPAHRAKIGDFWALQTGGPSRYAGGFGAAHLSLGLQPEHFEHWLSLWELNCRRNLAAAEAEELIGIAHQLASRLRRITTGPDRGAR